jgi:glycyl-radical enzyme activating protein
MATPTPDGAAARPAASRGDTPGRIFEIQRFSIHDGPGIRTTVFLKGCPLKCLWCHNPEGRAWPPVLSFIPEKCIGCGYCFRTCRRAAHRMADSRHVLDRALCEACGLCARECYAGALELAGRDTTVNDVLREVLCDVPFYETSGGGLTVSGGEPLMQIEFTAALLTAARQERLHCAMETSGYAGFDRLDRIRPLVDLFLYDIKDMDDARHRVFTGVSNAPILDNLKRLHARGALIRLRLPVIPGHNDRPDHFAAVAALARELPHLEGVEVLPFHPLGESKLKRFGLGSSLAGEASMPSRETVAGWVKTLRDLGAPVLNEPAAA